MPSSYITRVDLGIDSNTMRYQGIDEPSHLLPFPKAGASGSEAVIPLY